MSIQELKLKHALNEAKTQPKDMKPSSLDAIALLDAEIYKLDDSKIEMEHSHTFMTAENS